MGNLVRCHLCDGHGYLGNVDSLCRLCTGCGQFCRFCGHRTQCDHTRGEPPARRESSYLWYTPMGVDS